jgi:hypothetical protein
MIARIVVAIIFFAIMALVVRPFVRFMIEDVGFGAGVLMLTGIVCGAIWLDRRERQVTGLPPPDREERLWELGGLAMVLVLAVTWTLR